MVAKWFSQNPVYGRSAKFAAFPYGLNHKAILDVATALVAFAEHPPPRKRALGLAHLSMHRMNGWMRRGLPQGPVLEKPDYYAHMAAHEFFLAPCGDRCDTYRAYEAIAFGAVPVSNAPPYEYGAGLFADSAVLEAPRKYANVVSGMQKGRLPPYAEPDRALVILDYWRAKLRDVAAPLDAPVPPNPADPDATPPRVPYRADLGWFQYKSP